ncbi:unnamed protein product [Vitrella brassicaformis CCMP3155]|uniref:Cysteine-rich PDZ-binding protein n=1 Tax=Vitrella brassicaformis (strain CCMP3155) TaxID=1169540 RepID=A0A0G4EH27_VITBC|nr:unnamed protein product [Vitrella brassicaformis CCMP3155]|mmetsp:Transcript_39032/g.97725  ORF Transcript_39032/g.97725 Transcript_39032/m.97725 type:complete len:103 (-) Transcript_39032:446-754(-)|eukprot:CEL95774.1 unnamed protein product [Vitrella brassicaformis CCMP3155]
MVCEKCQKKLSKLVTPDAWRDGARNTTGGADGGRKVGGNVLTDKKSKFRASPYGLAAGHCKLCKSSLHQAGVYCSDCAHKKGRCAMCGKKMVDVSSHNMALT